MTPDEQRLNALQLAHHEFIENMIDKGEVIERAKAYYEFLLGHHDEANAKVGVK